MTGSNTLVSNRQRYTNEDVAVPLQCNLPFGCSVIARLSQALCTHILEFSHFT
jgi:hypothetical protein